MRLSGNAIMTRLASTEGADRSDQSQPILLENALDAANHFSHGNIIRPKAMPLSAARFTTGTHRSEIAPAAAHTLICSTRAKGHLHGSIDAQKVCDPVRSGVITFAPAQTSQNYEFEGRTINTVLLIEPSLIQRAVEADPQLGGAGCLEPLGCVVRPGLQRLIDEQYEIFANGNVGWRVLSESIALRIAYELLTTFSGSKAKTSGATPLSQIELMQLVDYIEAEMEANFGLSDLAEVLDRDTFGFSRAFKAATGESPHQFVIQRRLSKAQELLQNTALSLADIAYATGFSSQSHMTATFSKHIGHPPGQYRRIANS